MQKEEMALILHTENYAALVNPSFAVTGFPNSP